MAHVSDIGFRLDAPAWAAKNGHEVLGIKPEGCAAGTPRTWTPLLDKAFATMMPAGPDKMKLSQMHMLGGGTAMIKKIMKDNKVPSLPELIASAQGSGFRLVACTDGPARPA